MNTQPGSITADNVGDALTQILTERAGDNLNDQVSAQIHALVGAVTQHYTTGTGTFTIFFENEGAHLSLPSPDSLGADEIDVDSEEELNVVDALRSDWLDFAVEVSAANLTPVSFTDELIMVGSRRLWSKPRPSASD